MQSIGCLFPNSELLKVGFNQRLSEYLLFSDLFELRTSDMFMISSFPRALTLPHVLLDHWTGKSNPLRCVRFILCAYSLCFLLNAMVQFVSHDQLLKQLRSGLFKPNCGVGELCSFVMPFLLILPPKLCSHNRSIVSPWLYYSRR